MSWLARLLPPDKRDWGRALLAEMDQLDSRRSRLGWLTGGGVVVIRSWLDWMIGGNVMKTVLVTLSAVNVALGVFLAGIYLFTPGNPPIVAIIAGGLIIQGGYTLWYQTGRLRDMEPWATRALLSGETVSILIGAGWFVLSALANIDPPDGDYEYGPMAVGGLIAVQAAVAIHMYAVRRGAVRVDSPIEY